jgi:hypothetical protein
MKTKSIKKEIEIRKINSPKVRTERDMGDVFVDQ